MKVDFLLKQIMNIQIQPGTQLEVPKLLGAVKHKMTYVGPVGPNGEDIVNNTPEKGVHLDHLDHAIGDLPCKIAAPGPKSYLESQTVVSRALKQLGRPWRLFSNNCEDTANYARTGRATSPQVEFWVGVLILAGLLGLAVFLYKRR